MHPGELCAQGGKTHPGGVYFVPMLDNTPKQSSPPRHLLRRAFAIFLLAGLTGSAFSQSNAHPRVALIFDDGPFAGSAENFLALLAKEQVHVTFSHEGQNVAAHPELARAVAAAGHEIFNHSYTHPHFATLDDATIRREIADTQATILAATGRAPRWFWLPFGDWDNRIAAAVRAAGMEPFPTPLYHGISTEDWRDEITAATIYQRATTGIVDKTMIYCHEWPEKTLATLPAIIAELKRQGCVFVTASELAALTVSPASITSQTATTGHNTTLSVPSATGALQWRISTDFGSTWTNLANDSSYRGVNSNTLTITGVTAALNTTLYLLVSTNNGATTYPCMIKLLVRPNFLPYPTAIAIDNQNHLFVADANSDTINLISSESVVSVFAGTTGQTGTADGIARAARFNNPSGLAIATDDRLIVTDTANATLRLIATDGAVSTIAGSTTARGNTDGPGTSATFSAPVGVAQDSSGNLYVADSMNHTIRKISASGVVSTFAGTAGASGSSDGDGSAARFNFPTGIAVDANGTVYVSDTNNNLLRKITPTGTVTTLAGLVGVSGTQDGNGSNALFNHPGGLTVDGSGNLYLADTGNSTLRRITPDGTVTTLAGLPGIAGLKDGVGTDAWFNQPLDVRLSAQGILYVADTGNAIIRRVSLDGMVSTLDLASLENSEPPPPTTTPPTTPPTTTTPAPSSSGGSGGGGASSPWLLGFMGVFWLMRRITHRRP